MFGVAVEEDRRHAGHRSESTNAGALSIVKSENKQIRNETLLESACLPLVLTGPSLVNQLFPVE